MKYEVIFLSGQIRIYECNMDLLMTYSDSISNRSTHIGYKVGDKWRFVLRTDSIASIQLLPANAGERSDP